jgi:hypothetical protein
VPLSQAYSNNVIEMANTYLDAAGKIDTATLAGKLKMAQTALVGFPAMMDKTKTAQDNLTSSSWALSQMMSALALAKATDTKQQQQQLTLQIQTITGDLKELRTRWQMLTSTTVGVTPPAQVDNSGVPAPDIQLPQQTTSGGSRWQTIQFTSSTTSRADVASSSSEASVGLLVVLVIHTYTR